MTEKQEKAGSESASGKRLPDADLFPIYGKDESVPDMTELEKARGSTLKKLMVGMLLFLGVLAAFSVIGFWYFGPRDSGFTGDQVTLAIEGPKKMKSGENASFVVKYRNMADIPLGTASLEVNLPKGFVLGKSEPSAADGSKWKIGSLAPRERGEISFEGFFLAPLDREQDIQAVLTYRPADFNSEFQKVATESVRTEGSVLQMRVNGPSKTVPGDKVELTLEYKNDSEVRFTNLEVRSAFPNEFIPESSVPQAEDDLMTRWRVGELGAGGTATVKITGTFSSEARGRIVLPAEIGYLNELETFVPQAREEAETEVLEGQAIAVLALNGSTDDTTVRLGDTLRFSVSYRNTGQASLGNVRVNAIIETSPPNGLLDWSLIKDDNVGTLDGNRITWSSKQIVSLARLDAGDEGVIEFSIPVAAALPPDSPESGDAVPSVRSWVEMQIESIDGDIVERTAKSQAVTAKLLSDAKFAATARYYDDEGIPIGSGALPPEVGKQTTYRVFWTLTNSAHELADLKAKAKLPANVEWNGWSQVGAGDLTYDAANRELTWSLNWLPLSVNLVEMAFDLTITPTEEQRDRLPTIIDAVTFEAKDQAAQSKFSQSLPPLTTSLEDDTRAMGKGRVR